MRPGPGRAEWPLVLFTVLVPAAAGLAAAGAALPGAPAGRAPLLALMLLGLGLLAATAHLGRAGGARFALANLRTSWLSRELLLTLLFAAAVLAWVATKHRIAGIAAAVLGLPLVLAMVGVYRIRTVPPWDTRLTPAAFLGTAAVLGPALLAGAHPDRAPPWLLPATAGAAVLAALVTLAHFRRFGRAALRPILIARLLATAAGATLLLFAAPTAAAAALLLSELPARHLFYATHRRQGL